jgi:uncharacterized protein
MRHKIIIICIAAAFFALVYFYEFFEYGKEKGEVAIGKTIFKAEIVSSDSKRQKGLGARKKLCQKCSMLLVFPGQDLWGIWMKGMEFDLDIIWISGSRIIKIEKNVSKNSKDIFFPKDPADKVLELNAGVTDRKGIKTGDAVEIRK